MGSDFRSANFYAVGGPVQPDRACYVKRDADDLLLRRLIGGDYCHVLSQRHTGKTSLAAHTAWSLRDRDVRVAVIDFTQLMRNEQDDTSGRWYYSIAYRIVRDLRIKSDMQAWWADHSGLTNQQRLVEFFFEVVLASGDHRYVVFVDRLEVMAGHPLGQEFLNAVRSCYDMRSTEPEFQRLTFCLLGAGAPEELANDVQDSPFGISVPIPLSDFCRSEMDVLLAGLGTDNINVEQVLARIWWFTSGHPYLTQKLFRGLARRQNDMLSGKTVDELVAKLFFGSAEPEESHLAAVAETLLQQNPGRVARLSMYGKIRKGGDVSILKSSRAQCELLAAGVVVEGPSGMLVLRNKIYAEVFSSRWANQHLPFGWRRLSIAAAAALVLVLVPMWYTKYLPAPYERALTAASQDYQVAYEAYESLRFLPGYGDHADSLFAEFLARQSRSAESLADATRTYERMQSVPGAEQQARELFAEFWARQSKALAMRGARDGALLAQLNALDVPSDERRMNAAGLIGNDYRQLLGTIRVGGSLRSMQVDAQTSQLALLDDQQSVQLWQLQGNQMAVQLSDFELAAEERLQIQSRLIVSAPPSADTMQVSVLTDHPRVSDLQLLVRAPSGSTVKLNLAEATAGAQSGEYLFSAESVPALQALLADDASGTWSASFADTERGVTGVLLGWDIRIPEALTERIDDTSLAAQIPEPVLTTMVYSVLGPLGKTALAWPDDEDVAGDLLVWDLASAAVLSRIPRDDDFVDAIYALNGAAVLTIGQRELQVWDIGTGARRGSIVLPTGGGSPQAISIDGRYLVLGIDRDDGSRGYRTWDLETLEPRGEIISAEGAGAVAIDSRGRYLAIADKDRLVRIWSVRDATLFREFQQSNPARHIAFDSAGRWLVSQDSRQTLRVWAVEGRQNFPVLERNGNQFWQYEFSTNGDQIFVGSGGRSYDLVSLPVSRVTGQSVRHPTLIADSEYPALPQPILIASQNLAITHDGKHEVKLWQLSAQSSLVDSIAGVPISRSALTVNGDRIALGSADGGVRVFPFDSDPSLMIFPGADSLSNSHASAISVLSFDRTGDLLASGSVNGTIKIWDSKAGIPLQFDARHQDSPILDLKFSPLSNVLISGSKGMIVVTDVLSGERLAEQRFSGSVPQISVIDSMDAVLVSGAQTGVALWRWREGSYEQLVPPEYGVRYAVAAADNKLLVTAGEDNRLRLWDVATRQQVGEPALLPGRADNLWAFSNPNQVVLRSGHWLQHYDLSSIGLAPLSSVLLPEATAVVQPDSNAGIANVLVEVAGLRPMVQQISLGSSAYPILTGEPAALLDEWRNRLAYDDVFAEQTGGL
jgi:WD40 repeat protein